ncbi:Zinc finger A20 and AN1 domain-containing stress-associated protein 4 [Capsicum baccatum]|uniref:Zinc finger A20 and AN1 domain-containing stress-associated protein 4 n=1 Tax=Capsicum baccatum TaxID=33114 RepID=A0A2G2VAY0_CAPBA|nr:Zinc finger A20 and AN1 domain-containing stress-associated protein 4 [Capsicum baccatum]
MDFEMAEIKILEPGLQRLRDKCTLTYPTRYFSPLEDEEDLVGNSLDHHSTESSLFSSPNSSSKDRVLAESVDSVDDEPLFPEPDRDLSDCETSLSTRRSCRELIHNVSEDLPVEDGFTVSHFLLNEHEMFLSFLWMDFDKLIEWDMSHSLGKCTNFEIEEYACGTEVVRHILQELVDEVLLDLCSSSKIWWNCYDESELALAGVAVASADLASQISQVKSKEGLKKFTACRKRVGLTGFSCKCGDLCCAVHHYSDKHN